ncbi:hypothetical protein NUACC21_06650 [Scytonema sp. NUACC21]
MRTQDHPTHQHPVQDHPTPPYYDPKPAKLSTVEDHGQNDPEKSLPLQLSINVSIGVLVVLLFATAYYYGLF